MFVRLHHMSVRFMYMVVSGLSERLQRYYMFLLFMYIVVAELSEALGVVSEDIRLMFMTTSAHHTLVTFVHKDPTRG